MGLPVAASACGAEPSSGRRYTVAGRGRGVLSVRAGASSADTSKGCASPAWVVHT